MKVKKGEKCMAFSVKLFRVVGCWPKWDQMHKTSERVYFCYTLLTYAVLCIYTVILIYGLIIQYSAWKSLEEAIEELIVFATGFIVLLKFTLILWNQKALQNMIDYINEDLNKREIKDEEDDSVIKFCIKHEKFLTKTYVFFGYCITILYTTSSVIRIIREGSSSGEHYTLPLKYPFRPQHFPMYHLLYLHQLIVMILNGHVGTLADTFFSCLAFYLCGHFEIMKNRIAKEGGIITKNFVSYHNEMIRMVTSLQAVYGSFLFFMLLSNSFLICLGLLQITQTENINLLYYIKCLIYVTIKLSQMFLYCWYGEQIIKKSTAVGFGAYSGIWNEVRNRRVANDIRMVIFRSQKPVTIKAKAHIVMSLPILAKVMNIAYSFFTMIKSTQKHVGET